MATEKTIRERAHYLVNTSVNNLQSSLYFYKWDVKRDVETIRYGLGICLRRGEKTKANLLRRKLSQMEKNIKTLMEAENAKANSTKTH